MSYHYILIQICWYIATIAQITTVSYFPLVIYWQTFCCPLRYIACQKIVILNGLKQIILLQVSLITLRYMRKSTHKALLVRCFSLSLSHRRSCSPFSPNAASQSAQLNNCWTLSWTSLTMSTAVFWMLWRKQATSMCLKSSCLAAAKVRMVDDITLRRIRRRPIVRLLVAYVIFSTLNVMLILIIEVVISLGLPCSLYFGVYIAVFRFGWQICTHTNYPSTLRVLGGHFGCQTFRTCCGTVSSRGSQQRRAGVRQLWGNVVHTEWEAVVDAQSQDQRSVWQVPQRTGQHWTTTCPQSHHRTTRSVICCCVFLCCSVICKVSTIDTTRTSK